MNEGLRIRGRWRVEKFHDEAARAAGTPFAVEEFENILVTAGLAELGKLLTGTGTPTAFNAANAYIGVGDSASAAAVGQTDLQGASKARAAMVATYPLTPAAGVYTWRADFGAGVANFAWAEFGLFNAAAAGTMLNRGVSAQGTKTAGQVWTATLTVTVT